MLIVWSDSCSDCSIEKSFFSPSIGRKTLSHELFLW
jgi:hypothetical protein